MRFVWLAVLGACGFSSSVNTTDSSSIDAPMIDAPKPDGAPGAARKKRITIPDAKVFGTLTDFPVWLVIDDMPGLGAKATASGDDIYFTGLDGTPLEHQRVAWNKATGHLEAWVRTNLVDGAASEFELRYGDPGPAHLPDAPTTFANGFVAVWHMDALDGTTVADARNSIAGTAVNGPVAAIGKLGGAIDFDGTNDEITFANPMLGNASSTISAWVSVAQPLAGFSSVMTVGNPAANQSRFFHTNYGGLCRGFYGNDVMNNIDIHNSTFTLLHWVYDAGAARSILYRDGMMVGTAASVSGTINTQGGVGHIGTAPMQWGPGGNTTNPLNGLLDEVRIASVPRSLAWIRTEHANQSDVASFFLPLGPEEPAQ